jgi:hypothetical protein
LFCLVWHKMRSMLTPNFLVVSKASFLWGIGYSDPLSETHAFWMETSRGKTTKALSSWKGKLLSLGGRLILINLVLTNMVLHIILARGHRQKQTSIG